MSVIKLTNDVKISSESLMTFIDTSNHIASVKNGNSYTATEDCIMVYYKEGEGITTMALDGVSIGNIYGYGAVARQTVIFPMKRGQIFTTAVTSHSPTRYYYVFKFK